MDVSSLWKGYKMFREELLEEAEVSDGSPEELGGRTYTLLFSAVVMLFKGIELKVYSERWREKLC